MFIKQIKGTYGTFKDENIEFTDGLNIISKDNEWGKTTLISFIKTMFYGLNTSKRDKKDWVSEKTKYTSNGVFSGEMTINLNDEDIIVSRQKQDKLQSFDSYNKDTGAKTSYSSSNFGENILGVSVDAFCNSALIEFDNRLISNSKELEALIVSMSTTGDIDTNYEKAIDILKKAKSDIEKSKGLRSDIDAKLLEVEVNIRKIDYIKEEILKYNDELSESQLDLDEKKANYEKAFEDGTLLKIQETESEKMKLAQIDGVLKSLSSEYYDAKDLTLAEETYSNYVDSYNKAERFRLEFQAEKEKNQYAREEILIEKDDYYSKFKIRPISFIFALIFAGISIFSFTRDFDVDTITAQLVKFGISASVVEQFFEYLVDGFDFSKIPFYTGIAFLVVALIFFASSIKRRSYFGSYSDEFDKKIADIDDNEAFLIKKHKDLCEKAELRLKEFAFGCQRIGIQNINNFEYIHSTLVRLREVNQKYQNTLKEKAHIESSSNDAKRLEKIEQIDKDISFAQSEYNQTEASFNIINNKINALSSKLSDILPLEQLQNEKDALLLQASALDSKINSLNIALLALDEANQNLTVKLSPKISDLASKYLSILTNSKYDTVVLRKDLEALCKTENNFNLQGKLNLSSGTKEQLYFALRLAICEVLIDKKVPIILDDPFVFYDENRMQKAVDLLAEIAKERQVLLLTCHTREKKYFNNI